MAGRVTASDIRSRKGDGPPLVMITAYDCPTARIVDSAGVDIILVGDTLSMVVLGHEDTLHVDIDVMTHHVAAVANARPRALVVGDLPWMSYHLTPQDATQNAARLVRAGADVVKLEGGRKRLAAIASILDAEIPVMGHLGLTPQSVHVTGGFKVQAKDVGGVDALLADAQALDEAGCFALVLECVPGPVARIVTEAVSIPTIGIGSGSACDGQVIVFHDMLGLGDPDMHEPRYVRRYAELGEQARDAVMRYTRDVRERSFPSAAETYKLPASAARALADRGVAL